MKHSVRHRHFHCGIRSPLQSEKFLIEALKVFPKIQFFKNRIQKIRHRAIV